MLCSTLCPFKFCNHLAEEDRVVIVVVFSLVLCDCYCYLPLPRGALGWSSVCDCDIS